MSNAAERALATAQALRERFIRGEALTSSEVDLVVLANTLLIERRDRGSLTVQMLEIPVADIRFILGVRDFKSPNEEEVARRINGWLLKLEGAIAHAKPRD